MPNININILIRSYSHRYYLEYRSRSQAHVGNGLRIAYISESLGPSIPTRVAFSQLLPIGS